MGFVVVGLLLVLVLAACWKMYQDDQRRKAEARAKKMESMPMEAWPDPGLAFVPGTGGGGGAQRRTSQQRPSLTKLGRQAPFLSAVKQESGAGQSPS